MRICRVNKQSNIFCCCFCCRWNCISHPVFGISGINCELLPCEAVNPCDNGAECVEEADPVLFPLGFRCRCRQGFTGPRCEINIDECSSNPCLHGFCYDGKYSYLRLELPNTKRFPSVWLAHWYSRKALCVEQRHCWFTPLTVLAVT